MLTATSCVHPVERRDWSAYEGPGAEHFHAPQLRPPQFPDPFEPWNRGVSAVNHVLIVGIADPLGRVYRLLIPRFVRERLGEFASNLLYPRNLAANLLQGKLRGARDETWRFGINTTAGLLGFFDPATRWGIPASEEDFGQVLGAWGWTPSTYLVLPMWGPSTLRDAIGLAPDTLLDPASYFFPASPVLTFNELVDSIDAYERFVASSYDPYDDARILWTLNRDEEIFGPSFRRHRDISAQTQTLQAAFLAPRDPEFASRLHTGKVAIPSTGRRLPYSFRLQAHRAPLLLLLPGLGSHRLGASSLALAEMAFERGFSVAIVSSAMNFEFMARASSVSVPGHAPVDAADVHVALDAIAHDLQTRHAERIGARVLMGYSLGAFHAFYIAAAAARPESRLVAFDRYVMLDAPVRLLHALERLDAFYDAPLAFPPAERDAQTLNILRKALHFGKQALDRANGEPYSRLDAADLGGGSLTPGGELPFSNLEAEYLIGLAFRRTLQSVIFDSQTREDLGVLKTPRGAFHRWAAYEEIADYSFAEYLYAFLLPYFRDRRHEVASAEELIASNDLHAIADVLHENPRIRLFANRNDFLTSNADVDWLTGLLGAQRVRFFPDGGHLGNLHQPEVQRAIMDSLDDLVAGDRNAGSDVR